MTSPILPQCRHRGARIAIQRWVCHSSRIVAPARVVSSEMCAVHCPYVDHDEDPDAPARIEQQLFLGQIARDSKALPEGWQCWEVAQTAHRQLLNEAASRDYAAPSDCEGRGIVIAAGGPLYFGMAFICVRVLRELGCTLPIELWHLGPDELDQDMTRMAQHLGVTCRDAFDIQPRPRILRGWQLKPFSVIHSRFREVLFLDADNMPARDPTYLFDDPQYRRQGAIFWPDLPESVQKVDWVPEVAWDIAGISDRYGQAFESGQFLVDKQQVWRELQVAMHLNERSDFWYSYIYGDKDTFKLAWHKCGHPYAITTTPAQWHAPAIFQYDLDGRLVFTHVCQGKGELLCGERLAALPQADLLIEAAGELHAQWRAAGAAPL